MRTLVKLGVIVWLLAACAGEVGERQSSTTAVDQTGSLPLSGPAIRGAPDLVANREPLPYCGAEIGGDFPDRNPYEYIDIVAGAGECYRSRAAAGLPTEVITVAFTIEGDPNMTIRRLMADGREIIFWDATQDKFGPLAWVMIECDHYSETGSGNVKCTDGIELPQ